MTELGYRPSKMDATSNTSEVTQYQPKIKRFLHGYQQFRERHPAMATVAETTTLYGVNKALEKAVERYGRGLKIGHGRESKQRHIFERYPVAATVITTGPIPVLEELFQRKFVSDYIDRKGYNGGIHWGVGQAVLFALSPQHLGREAVPIPHFNFGLNAWEKQRKFGYPYAVLSHATYNALAATDYIIQARKKKRVK